MAERLDISKQFVRNLIHNGDLRTVRIGARLLVPEDELVAFVAKLRREP